MLVPAERPRYSNDVPLPTKNLFETEVVLEPVPPLAVGRIPLTSEVRDAWPAVRSPAELDFTMPEERFERVVEPVSVEDDVTYKSPVTCNVEEGDKFPIPTLVYVEAVSAVLASTVSPVR